MMYLLSKFHCLVGDEEILPNVFYGFEKKLNAPSKVIGFNGEMPFLLNLGNSCVHNNPDIVEKLDLNSNTFVFLNKYTPQETYVFSLKVKNKQYFLSVGNKLTISSDNGIICDLEINKNIQFSSFEEIGERVAFYFEGKRKYVVIVSGEKLEYANYYDEVNFGDGEYLFMTRLQDCVNHGKVAKISDGKFEQYLIYLDDYEMKMKSEFVHLVFMDCLLVGNFKYCNELLDLGIKQKNEAKLKDFFEEFDDYIPFDRLVFLFKKNTLAGVYEFIVNGLKIENIIPHHPLPC